MGLAAESPAHRAWSLPLSVVYAMVISRSSALATGGYRAGRLPRDCNRLVGGGASGGNGARGAKLHRVRYRMVPRLPSGERRAEELGRMAHARRDDSWHTLSATAHPRSSSPVFIGRELRGTSLADVPADWETKCPNASRANR